MLPFSKLAQTLAALRKDTLALRNHHTSKMVFIPLQNGNVLYVECASLDQMSLLTHMTPTTGGWDLELNADTIRVNFKGCSTVVRPLSFSAVNVPYDQQQLVEWVQSWRGQGKPLLVGQT